MHTLLPFTLARFALAILVAAACTSCASDGPDEAAQPQSEETPIAVSEQPDDDPAGLTITVFDETGMPDWKPPPWEGFVVELAPVTMREETTAVGEGDVGGATPLGTSCEQLLADFPQLTGCQEYTDEYPEEGTYVDVGRLDPDGTMTIDAPSVASSLRIEAIDPADELCSWFGYLEIEPGETTADIGVSLACA